MQHAPLGSAGPREQNTLIEICYRFDKRLKPLMLAGDGVSRIYVCRDNAVFAANRQHLFRFLAANLLHESSHVIDSLAVATFSNLAFTSIFGTFLAIADRIS